MRNLVLLSCAFSPDNTAAATRPAQLYKYLPENGYSTFVVASSFEGGINPQPNIHRVPGRSERFSTRFAAALAGIFMRYLAPYNDRLTWFPYAVGKTRELMQSIPIDGIMSTSPFLASHIAAYRLKRLTGIPWVADFQDPLRDNPTRRRRWPYPYDALIESRIFKRADWLIANTDNVESRWRERYPAFSGKMSVLWNSFDPQERVEIVTRPERPFRVLAHVGSLYGDRDPLVLLESVERLQLPSSDFRIKLVGPIETAMLERNRGIFERMRNAGLLQYNNRLVDRREALAETASADYLVVLDIAVVNASLQLPSKLLDCVRYGTPIVAFTRRGSPTDRILAQSGAVYVSIDPTDDAGRIDRDLIGFLRQPMRQGAPTRWFEETFNARAQARTVANIWGELLKAPGRTAPGGEHAGTDP